MDCCKAISIAARYDGDVWEDFWKRPGVFDFEPLPLGVIVTVAGTGSECNGGAVITNEELKIKTGRDYPQCNPKFALLDPTYTYSVPKKQMVSGGFDILSHIMEIYFSEPNEDNVSDDISEALMRSAIRNLRAAIQNPQDYTARSNLMWAATMAENRVIKLGKRMDFECHQMEHQLGAYTNCNHGEELAVLHPVYYRHIYKYGLPKFKRFATEVMGVSAEAKTDEEIALAGIEALEDFIVEIGLPVSLQDLGVNENTDLKESDQKENYWNLNVYSTYSRTFADKHNFKIMGGFQAEEWDYHYFDVTKYGVISGDYPEFNLTTGMSASGEEKATVVTGDSKDWATAGFYGRLNYDYDGRYLLEVNMRYDGSSRFRRESRWQISPSFSLGWNIAQEKFFESLSNTTFLLYRLSGLLNPPVG